ncbi:lipase family protein [Pseudomonas sp. SCB32]|uniref:lipase family protein n=1 Tax=Pseudomonas sp. SCB32 TaxID=2653853 RepID=UPI0012642BB3|nr:lipase family protein [Pseudomonas sp. SCB32]
MSDRNHRTDTLCPLKDVQAGKQIKHWLEFQLIDERGEPLANQRYRVINEAVRSGEVPEFRGKSDAKGVVRLDGLKSLAVTLFIAADPFAKELQTRRLRPIRAETPIEKVHAYTYEPSPSGFSPREKDARAAGNLYHYLRIGQLSDRLPKLDPPLADPKKLPSFHFPDPDFKGFTVPAEQLDRRHVLEVCPFRAWQLVLHHQPEYSMVNGYNLGLMANLSYSTLVQKQRKAAKKTRKEVDLAVVFGGVEELFFRQCLDLSRTPTMLDPKGQAFPAVVVDVPFDERYTTAIMLDSTEAETLPSDPRTPFRIIENTQLFYFSNKKQVVVAWRGTQEPMDWLTDLQYRPRPTNGTGCDIKRPGNQCTFLTSAGSVHDGFLQAFEIAKKLFPTRFLEIEQEITNKKLFICGHSLGGALALIHSAELKNANPLLYTYGMPRTFTRKAVESLGAVTHFRHVNDADTITSVPPEAELNNWLYGVFGPLGPDLGYVWSVPELLVSKLTGFGDPYWHHGKIAMHYRADQHIAIPASAYPAYKSKDGLGAPYYNTIRAPLPERAFLYLVPSLNDAASRYAGEEQKALMKSLSKESMQRYFPPHTNPDRSNSRTNPMDHSMINAYLPFLHNQLLELSDPTRALVRKEQRKCFEEQMGHKDIPKAELQRNQHFLALQKLMPMTLRMTQDMEGGSEALQRFCREQEAGVPIEIMRARSHCRVPPQAATSKVEELTP